MKFDKLTEQIYHNKFIDNLRIHGFFDEEEFEMLCNSLNQISIELKKENVLERKLALYLYCIPMMARNAFQKCKDFDPNCKETFRLEDAWVDLDALVLECLADANE